jgi:hypothetical protein
MRFIRNYGIICRPLHDRLKKDAFHWGAAQPQAFDALKVSLITAHVLRLPDFTLPFILETYASRSGVGAVLMQDGRPTAFHSQALEQKAPAHSIYHKEALAILQALKKWRHYILGNHLIIRTDQQILKFMMTQWLTEGIQHKLLMKLLEFNHSIEYKKRSKKLSC